MEDLWEIALQYLIEQELTEPKWLDLNKRLRQRQTTEQKCQVFEMDYILLRNT